MIVCEHLSNGSLGGFSRLRTRVLRHHVTHVPEAQHQGAFEAAVG
jgi:hypothetical protein